MESCACVTVEPTERGMTVIDSFHLYYTFKFLTNKPVPEFRNSPQFLHMLKAEEEGLIRITVEVPDDQIGPFRNALIRCVESKEYGEVADAWNKEREKVCDAVVKDLFLSISKWTKESMRTWAEEWVAEACRQELEFRVNVRPYATPEMEHGEIPTVLALTNGRGGPRDATMAVMLDDEGNIRTQTKFDDLREEADRAAFIELVERRKPKVIAVGGMSINTIKVRDAATAALRAIAARASGEVAPDSTDYGAQEDYLAALAEYEKKITPFLIPLIFVPDATARQYMLSEDAEKEHPTLPVNGRYALALARYVQNPLNAYCKLGKDILSVTFVEHHQKLISQERLLQHLERGLVNSVCVMGIEINSCVADPYQRCMLPFIAGLGPRKADALINGVNKNGSLVNRLAFSDLGLFGPTILENAAGFLSIQNDLDGLRLEVENPQDQPDPLDLTRIHPEDYEFAQKMCQDALDMDAEDVVDQHKSNVVLQLMLDDDRGQKLSELNIDDFAYNLQRQGEGNKRHTLGEIVAELISYRADRRPAFYEPTGWEVLTMLTGETKRTLDVGLRVTATVRKAIQSRVFCSLDSSIDAVLERDYVSDEYHAVSSCEDLFKPRQSVKAVVISIDLNQFSVRISTRHSDLSQGVEFLQTFNDDPYNDLNRQRRAEEVAAQKKQREAGRVKRVVNHPNWHVMNSGQAEQFLASQQRGDLVIRPSSKGSDHLAITWKVDDGIYQHIDVKEEDKPNDYSVGRMLLVGKYTYLDLDQLIIEHVNRLAQKFDEISLNEKFKPEHELEGYLKNYVLAHPGRSTYGFSVDSDRPGYLKLCFLNAPTKDGGVIHTWHVKVLPDAYQLNGASVPGVTELCNAFKTQYSARLVEKGVQAGGKTPGIRSGPTPMHGGRTPGLGGRTPALGGRTPALGGRTPAGVMRGGATPMYGQTGRTPMQPGMTPNPYGVRQPYGGATPGGRTPAYGRPPVPGYGGPPGPGGPPFPPNGYPGGPPPPQGYGGSAGPSGMNPERAAMLARGNRY